MTASVDVVVLGAGISGLTTGYQLQSAGLDVLVLDRRTYAGGRTHSERIDGFLMEHGPTGMVGPTSAAEQLIADLGLTREKVERGLDVRHRYLVRDGSLRALPIHPIGFFLSSFFSLPARLRLLSELVIPARAEDETVADFVRRRFGTELLDYVFNPLVGGLLAGDPETLSVTAAFPELKRLEIQSGSVIGGVAVSRIRRHRTDNRFFGRRSLFSFRNGMSTLPNALAAKLGQRLQLGHRVESILRSSDGGFLVKSRTSDGHCRTFARIVVVALPAYGAAEVIRAIDPKVAATLACIAHPPIAVVFLGYRREDIGHPLDGLGFLAPAVERCRALGIMFSSTLFRARAPEGHVALTATIGGARQPELARLPAADLQDCVDEEIGRLLDRRRPPVLARTRYWARGLPQYGLEHAARVQALRRMEEKTPGLFFTGNYLCGVSTSICIAQGIAAADRAARFHQTDTSLQRACA